MQEKHSFPGLNEDFNHQNDEGVLARLMDLRGRLVGLRPDEAFIPPRIEKTGPLHIFHPGKFIKPEQNS